MIKSNSNVIRLRQQVMPEMAASGATVDTARVIGRDNGEFLLVTAGTLALRAQKAAGCLLEPEDNDTVLIVRNAQEGHFILTVLVRGQSAGRVILPDDATLCVEAGTLRLAGEAVEITGEKAAGMTAPEIKLQGVKGEALFADLSLIACCAALQAGKLSLVAATIDTVAERITQRVRDCFRWVARMDSTKAGQVSINATNRFDVSAEDASLVAECDVKIEGDKIRLG
jgi:hypothetical protein